MRPSVTSLFSLLGFMVMIFGLPQTGSGQTLSSTTHQQGTMEPRDLQVDEALSTLAAMERGLLPPTGQEPAAPTNPTTEPAQLLALDPFLDTNAANSGSSSLFTPATGTPSAPTGPSNTPSGPTGPTASQLLTAQLQAQHDAYHASYDARLSALQQSQRNAMDAAHQQEALDHQAYPTYEEARLDAKADQLLPDIRNRVAMEPHLPSEKDADFVKRVQKHVGVPTKAKDIDTHLPDPSTVEDHQFLETVIDSVDPSQYKPTGQGPYTGDAYGKLLVTALTGSGLPLNKDGTEGKPNQVALLKDAVKTYKQDVADSYTTGIHSREEIGDHVAQDIHDDFHAQQDADHDVVHTGLQNDAATFNATEAAAHDQFHQQQEAQAAAGGATAPTNDPLAPAVAPTN